MTDKISIIIPFYNEEKTLKKSIDLLLNQSLKPDEIIFINSRSNDKSEKIIEKYSVKNKKIKVFNLNTPYPSDSKNLGIQISRNKIIAFMDCDLNFSKDWLKNQYLLLKKNNLDIVFGSCLLEGKNEFDTATVMHTYGFKKKHPCIPGSIMKKSIFKKIGFFEQARSYYDILWKKKVFESNLKCKVNFKSNLTYIGYNYSNNFINLFKKSSIYIESKINFYKSVYPYFYILGFLISIILIFAGNYIIVLSGLTILYFIRLSLGLKKSNLNANMFNSKLIIYFILNPIIIDLGRLQGSIFGFFRFIGINSILGFFAVSFIIVFYTPLFSILGNNLIVQDQLNKVDALVVFSGDGQTQYRNETYRDRALEALKLMKNGYAKKIYLSSGRDQTISDVIFLQTFLISKGIEKESIYIFQEYPSSTFENIKIVGLKLKEDNINNIIFITGPYHSKRSVLIWKKNFPSINLLSFSSEDKKISWKQDIDNINSIIYEYMAISYNKLKGYY